MTDRARRRLRPAASTRDARSMLIPTTPLIVTAAFGSELPAPRVAGALARGLAQAGVTADVCALAPRLGVGGSVRGALEELGLDARMRRARAVIIGEWLLDERTLAGSAAFEIATRARQSGVPAYAVTAENRLSPFDARMLDLQLVLTARSARALSAAGRKLASVI